MLTAAGKSVDSNAARLVRQDYYDDHNRPKQQSITITDDKGHVVSVDVAQGDKRFGGSEIAVEVTTDIIEVGAKSRQTDRITWRLDFFVSRTCGTSAYRISRSTTTGSRRRVTDESGMVAQTDC